MKKILALVLVLSLVLGTFSFAFADGHLPEDIVGEDSEEAVATLMALGVVNGYPDGTYKPERTVTRAEMTKLLVEAQGYGDLAAGATSTFPDVQGTWAESYVGFAASMGIVQGYPDGTFRPSQPMTVDEAMTMVIRALGYTDESLKGTWPTNYKVKALDLDLTDDMSALSGPGKRGDVAILLFNTLEARLVEVDADNAITFEMDGDDYRLFIDRIGKKVDMSDYEKAADQIVQPEDVYGDDAWDTAIDMTPYLFHTLTYYENNDGEVAYVSDVQTNELAGTVVSTTTGAITLDDDDDTEFDVAGAPLFLNGDETSAEADTLDPNQADVTVIYDDDDVVLGVVAWDYELVQSVNYSERTPLTLSRGGTYELPAMEEDDEDVLDVDNLTIEGDVDTLADIDTDDLVYYYASVDESDGYPGKVKLLVIRDTFEGKFTKRVSATEGVFGGTTFDVSVDSTVDLTTDATLAETYTLTLDKDGDIFSLELAEDTDTAEGFGLFVAQANGTLTSEFGEVSLDKAPRVKIFTSGGDVVTYDLDTSGLTLATATDTTTVGAIEIETDGSSSITINNTPFVISNLVEYELNSDGEITSITDASPTSYTDTAFDIDEMLLGNYDVVSSTLIFNIDDDTDEDTWEVIEVADLVEGIAGEYLIKSDSFDVEVMTVTSGLETGGTFAVITDVVETINSDDDVVYELTVLEDGVEKTYLTEDQTISYTVDTLVELTLDTGVVTGRTVIDAAGVTMADAVKVDSVDMTNLRLRDADNADVYGIDSDVAVYIIDGGEYEAASLSDVWADDYVILVDADGELHTDANYDGDAVIIVVNLDL
ncbi:MAG: S-layer homology domain-containing protein [Eubacteriales bacterium]